MLPHAVSSITGTVGGLVNPHYCYDANGNLTKVYTGGGGCTSTASKSVSWTSANMILQMVQGTTTVSLTYDEAHQRITQTEPSGTTAYFADPMTGAFEEEAGTTWNDYIAVDGKLVAEHIQPALPATPYVHYFINDHLGSVSIVVDAPNHALERDSYDAWGMRRNADGTDAPACSLVSSTKRGFTNQEMIDALCLVNLNARVYDPVIGRFLSPDDVTPDAYNLQSLNRYTYVRNEPLSHADPTGHMDDFTQQQYSDAVMRMTPEERGQLFEAGVITLAAPFAPAEIATGVGVGALVGGGASALNGDSRSQVVANTLNGGLTGGSTAVGGIVGGTVGKAGSIASKVGTISGEVASTYASTEAEGGSDVDAIIASGSAGIVGTVVTVAGGSRQTSERSAAGAAVFARDVLKSTFESSIETAVDKAAHVVVGAPQNSQPPVPSPQPQNSKLETSNNKPQRFVTNSELLGRQPDIKIFPTN